ncbi:MAG: threonylcarbamoyl-AMP synthase [Lewinellaceae bacterium]|nr:threonylcarbamoyl-AMP synthase [Phaeodactylibacter sp.]MCB9349751.1 threonylcarbamoyl-AMP synthase [Lewinellaceae bacterium]
MLLKINPDNPEGRKIRSAVDTLESGGVIIYPTDTVYALGCDINDNKAVDRICKLRGLDPNKAHLSLICRDISQVSDYSQQIDNQVFRLMKKHLPGPFTFVLNSNNQVPKMFKNRKRTIGIRIPDNNICMAIIEALGRPILTASLKSDDEILEYFTDPIDIYEDYKKLVDLVIDGGVGGNMPSTVVDYTGAEPVILREGAGVLEL